MSSVLIAGAGPAGLACALGLARGGLDVTVLEGAPKLRERPGGEGILPLGVEELNEFGLVPKLFEGGAKPFRGIAYFVDGREAARADFPGRAGKPALGLGVRRPLLEQALLEELQRLPGARVVMATAVTGLIEGGGRVVGLMAGGKRWEADAVVGADGLHSTVRRQLGLAIVPRDRPRFGVTGHFEWQDPHVSLSHVEVHLVESGEVYRTPCGDSLEGWIFLTGRETVEEWAPDLAARFIAALKRNPTLKGALEGARLVGRVAAAGPLHQPARAAASGGVLLIGDAAGFLDAITGEGLSLGLRMARSASRLLLESRASIGDAEMRAHDAAWARATREPWLLTRALLFLAQHRWLARKVLARLGRRPEITGKLLGVSSGHGSFEELSGRDVFYLATGL